VITTEFKKNCTAEELGLLYLILIDGFSYCNYEPSFDCLSFLRINMAIKKLDELKNKIKPENLPVVDSLQKKLTLEI